ncbi:MAG: ABC transporter substrate-binding protein [Betaproteobacteria bacterium]
MAHTQKRGNGRLKAAAAAITVAATLAALPAARADTTVNYMEVIRSIFYLPSYIAMEKGFFKEEGLDVKMSTAWGTAKVIPPLMSGAAEIVLLGPESQIYVENSPSPDKTKIFCQLTAKDGLLLLSRKKMTPAQFKWPMVKGKDYLDWTNGTTPQIDSEWVLKKHGMSSKDLGNYITNVASGNRDSAWIAGKGDFGTFFEPTASLIEREGKGQVVASLGNEIGPMAFTVFMASDKFIAKNPKTVQGWCNAIRKAQAFVASASPSDLAKLAAPHFKQLDYGLMLSAIKRYQGLGVWATDVTVSEQSMNKLQDIMVAGGVLKAEQRVAYDRAVTRVFSENAKKAVR